ncbi:hypothetical protein HU200_010528 [Digitaria exilis]|uniref:Rhomboid-like protein n=1 Tax=Digitaria exilis TaxID=1010633 RepID=A0A835FIR3_9POAL|nr:hypothetical protein HU200_010528 [Digitaria exilis]
MPLASGDDSAAERGRRGQIDGATSGHHRRAVPDQRKEATEADGDGRRGKEISRARTISFLSSLPCPPLLVSSLLPLASKRHPNRQRQRAATASSPPPLELSPLGFHSTEAGRKGGSGAGEKGGEGSAMASNGDGKGRVAAAGGGYGYGGYEGPEERKWWPWLVPTVIVACIAVFVVEMYENNCPKHGSPLGDCVAGFLRRFSFQPLRENPLLGPSSSTYVFAVQAFASLSAFVLPRVPNRDPN